MPVKRSLNSAGHKSLCVHCQYRLKPRALFNSRHVKRSYRSSYIPNHNKNLTHIASHPQQSITNSVLPSQSQPPPLFIDSQRPKSNVREKLRRWHAENRDADQTHILNEFQPSIINVEDRAVRTDQWPAQVQDDDDTTLDQNAVLDAFDRMSGPHEGMEALVIEFTRGDLVELTAKSGNSLAVFLTSNGEHNIFYAQDGSLRFTTYTGGLYRARKYFGRDAIQPVIDMLPEQAFLAKSYEELRDLRTSIPLEQGAHILRDLASFQKASEIYYRQHSKTMDELHKHVADTSGCKVMRINQLADTVLRIAELERSALAHPVAFEHATVRAIIRHPFGFTVSMRELIQHEEIGIESLETVKHIDAACSWIRAYQSRQAIASKGDSKWAQNTRHLAHQADRVSHFLTKCRLLISESRSIRPSNHHRQVLPGKICGTEFATDSKEIVHSHKFNDDDRCLISFVMHACHQHFTYNPSLLGLAAILIRATGAYEDVSESLGVDAEARRNFLVEIGVLQPFSIATAFDRDVLRADKILFHDYRELQPALSQETFDNETLGLVDSMSDLRKDWGNMLVLAIDNAGTQVVDDGISVEPISTEPGKCWLHVHISHISAWMKPDSVMARVAANATQSQYFCEGSIPMLPNRITKEHGIREGGTVLTFSMKVDESGGVIDEFRMQPAIIRNVEYADKKQVDELLGLRDQKVVGEKRYMVVGPEEQKDKVDTSQPLSFEAGKACAHLHQIAQSMSRSLLKSSEGAAANLEVIRPRHNLRVLGLQDTGEVFSRIDEQPTHAKFSTKSPTILWRHHEEKIRVGWNLANDRAPFDEVIQTFMMVTGLEAAKWANARGIPLPYFGSGIANESLLEHRDRFRTELLDAANTPQPGRLIVTNKLWRYWATKYGTRLISSKAIPHRGYGMVAYTKVTSPLRRYYDLLSMWQIDAALQHEHKQGRNLASQNDPTNLAFSGQDMDQIINATEAKQRKQQKVRADNDKHWFCQMMARALHLGGEELPKRMTALLGAQNGGRTSAYMLELDYQCWVKQDVGDDGNVLSPNDVWEVEIDFIALQSRIVWLKCKNRILSGQDDERRADR